LSVSSLLNKTCKVVRSTASIDSATGENLYTWANVASGVACTIQVSNSFQAQQQMAQTGVQELQAYFNTGQDVRVGDILSAMTGYSVGAEVTSKSTDDAGRTAYVRVTAVLKDGLKYQ